MQVVLPKFLPKSSQCKSIFNVLRIPIIFTEKLVFCETEGKWSPLDASQLYWTWLSDLAKCWSNHQSCPVIGQSSLISSYDWSIRDISINRNLETTRNSLAILWSFSFLVKFWFSMYSPCLVRKENIYSNLLSIAREVTGIYGIFKNLIG